MNKLFILAFFLTTASLTACSTTALQNNAMESPSAEQNKSGAENTPTLASTESGIATNKPANTFAAQTNETVGGSLTQKMNTVDKTKLSRALDKAIGKMTQWKNELTGISYSVVPVRRTTVDGNHFCRQYTMTASQGEATQELQETACIGQDGEWHPASS